MRLRRFGKRTARSVSPVRRRTWAQVRWNSSSIIVKISSRICASGTSFA